MTSTRITSKSHNSLATISAPSMTGTSEPHLRPSLMEPHVRYLLEKPWAEVASSTEWCGIEATRMITTPGNLSAIRDGAGMTCYHFSKRYPTYTAYQTHIDIQIQSETFTPVYYQGVGTQPVTFNPNAHGSTGPVSVSYPNYYWPQTGK